MTTVADFCLYCVVSFSVAAEVGASAGNALALGAGLDVHSAWGSGDLYNHLSL